MSASISSPKGGSSAATPRPRSSLHADGGCGCGGNCGGAGCSGGSCECGGGSTTGEAGPPWWSVHGAVSAPSGLFLDGDGQGGCPACDATRDRRWVHGAQITCDCATAGVRERLALHGAEAPSPQQRAWTGPESAESLGILLPGDWKFGFGGEVAEGLDGSQLRSGFESDPADDRHVGLRAVSDPCERAGGVLRTDAATLTRQYERTGLVSYGHYYDWCTGEPAAAIRDADLARWFEWLGLRHTQQHVFGEPDDFARDVGNVFACLNSCPDLANLTDRQGFNGRADTICYQRAQEAGYACGYPKQIGRPGGTCVVECEFGTALACALGRCQRGQKLAHCHCAPEAWTPYAARRFCESSADILVAAWCGLKDPNDIERGCDCHYVCGRTRGSALDCISAAEYAAGERNPWEA